MTNWQGVLNEWAISVLPIQSQGVLPQRVV